MNLLHFLYLQKREVKQTNTLCLYPRALNPLTRKNDQINGVHKTHVMLSSSTKNSKVRGFIFTQFNDIYEFLILLQKTPHFLFLVHENMGYQHNRQQTCVVYVIKTFLGNKGAGITIIKKEIKMKIQFLCHPVLMRHQRSSFEDSNIQYASELPFKIVMRNSYAYCIYSLGFTFTRVLKQLRI